MLALAPLRPARERCFTNQYLSQGAHGDCTLGAFAGPASGGRAGRAGNVI
jgi:hypothetical protein